MTTRAVDQNADTGQTPIRDLHRQLGEETDLGLQSEGERDHGHRCLEEIGHVLHSHDEIDLDHQS